MRFNTFECSCGAHLVLPKKTRPVCRRCGKQMKYAEQAKFQVKPSKLAIEVLNQIAGGKQ